MSSLARQTPKARTLSKARSIGSFFGHFFMVLRYGHPIGKHLPRTTTDFLQMQHRSLYPALHRREGRAWATSKWETAPDRNREFKFCRRTEKGREQLVVEALARVMWPDAEEN
jgi:PadR family transcriptional regulator PadR